MKLTLLCVVAILTATAADDEIPGALKAMDGKATVAGCRLAPDGAIVCIDALQGARENVLKLPLTKADTRRNLLGLFDVADNVLEVILGWNDTPKDQVRKYEFQVFRGKRGGSGKLSGAFALEGYNPVVGFYRPLDGRDKPKVIIDLTGGATWATSYVLSEDGSSVQRLFDANLHDFVDLNGDGVYDLIAWDRRPDDKRCHFGMFAQRVNPRIYLMSGHAYRQVWPPANSEWTQVMARLVDIDRDGTLELVALTDALMQSAGAQSLSVYRLGKSSFRLVAQAQAPWPRIAYWLSSDSATARPEINVLVADPAKCDAGGDPGGEGTATAVYVMEGESLQQIGIRPRH